MKIRCKDIYGNDHEVDEEMFYDRISVYGLAYKNNSLLLVQDPWAKKWDLPGGGVDPGENHIEALIREFFEETHLIASVTSDVIFSHSGYFIGPSVGEYWRSQRIVYEVDIDTTTPPRTEHFDVIEARFFTLSQIQELIYTKTANNLVELLIEKNLLRLSK